MTDSFLRQRRNLFIINGIILFAFHAKVNISKFTLAGVSFSGFGNPEAVYYFLWIVLAYFFYRFALFFIEDEMSKFTSKWVELMFSHTNDKLEKLACNYSGKGFVANSMSGYYQVKRNDWTLHYQVEERLNNSGDYNVINVELDISPFKLLWPQFKAVLKFCFFTSTLTNYLLPAALSFYVLFVVGFSSWEGSILNIFT